MKRRYAKKLATLVVLSSILCSSTKASPLTSTSNIIMDNDVGTISEQTDSQMIERIFTRKYSARTAYNDISMEDVMVLLGMDETALNNLTPNERESIYSCESITSSTAYLKISESEGISYLAEEEALKQSLMCASDAQGTYEDAYIRVWHAAIHEGNGVYLMTTDARWLKMPFFRGTDALGSISQLTSCDTKKCYRLLHIRFYHYRK